jgi:hypothetical protein
MAGSLADAFAEVKDRLPGKLGIVASQKVKKVEKGTDAETEHLIWRERFMPKKDGPALSEKEQIIVDHLVLNFITPVKNNPWLVTGRLHELNQLWKKKAKQNQWDWVTAITALIGCFDHISACVYMYNLDGDTSEARERWQKLLEEGAVKFPHFGYVFHPNK